MNIKNLAKTLCAEADRIGSADICSDVWLISRKEAEYEAKEYNLYPDRDFSSALYWIQIVDAELIPVGGPEDSDLLIFLESVEELGALFQGM
ncbi:hypothetical protein F3I16_13525 [Pseudomonas sp. L-22-4S-12]|uniref:hypothetical protein n=1 Tax=Pseudomonas sp. L-22-4S-12 TaxID=2610893 RepID=UPI00132A85FD|nr:hypothetical protein [Pseudomonas sp. L-22-4S-12]MWV17057.1 hypothetical protein [Pseudomonas sp. L-22-4S-12]